jgi:hypothetical protein
VDKFETRHVIGKKVLLQCDGHGNVRISRLDGATLWNVQVFADGAEIKLTSANGPDDRDWVAALSVEPHVSNSVTVRMLTSAEHLRKSKVRTTKLAVSPKPKSKEARRVLR